MIQNALFRSCLAAIPSEEKAKFDKTFNLAERLYERMAKSNMSLSQLATLLNIHKKTLAKFLTGRHKSNKQTIIKIERFLS